MHGRLFEIREQRLNRDEWITEESFYNEETGNKLMTFRLEDATAVDIAVMGKGESLL